MVKNIILKIGLGSYLYQIKEEGNIEKIVESLLTNKKINRVLTVEKNTPLTLWILTTVTQMKKKETSRILLIKAFGLMKNY